MQSHNLFWFLVLSPFQIGIGIRPWCQWEIWHLGRANRAGARGRAIAGGCSWEGQGGRAGRVGARIIAGGWDVPPRHSSLPCQLHGTPVQQKLMTSHSNKNWWHHTATKTDDITLQQKLMTSHSIKTDDITASKTDDIKMDDHDNKINMVLVHHRNGKSVAKP